MLEGFTHAPQPRKQEVPPRIPIEIRDIEDARDHVDELIAQGVRPVITVPEEYVDAIERYGITSVPKHDLLTGKKFSFVAGVIGIEPFLPQGEARRVFEVDPAQVRIEPRLTGSDAAFHGVVGFPDGVPASALSPLYEHPQSAEEKNMGPIH